MTRRRRFRISSVARLVVSGLVGLVAGGVVGLLVDAPYGVLAGWMGAAGTFLIWTWLLVGRMDADRTRRHARYDDAGRRVTDAVVLVAAVASLGAVALLLTASSSGSKVLQALLSVVSVAVSWFAVHTIFTLRYGGLWYGDGPHGPDGPPAGGIGFNEDDPPRYADFAYFAFTVGMTFQVSDTDISRTDIRALVLRHALLSYLLGAVVVAATINLVSGLAH
ncbi:DUF1345 domain-containing protein [Lapillicoccus jejuensis]